MIEILQANLEIFLLVFSLLSIGPFVFVLTSVLKGVVKMRTDHFAITLGAIFGVLIMTAIMSTLSGLTPALFIILPLAGIIQGALQGASAVGIKTASDSPAVNTEFVQQEELVELPEEIKSIIENES